MTAIVPLHFSTGKGDLALEVRGDYAKTPELEAQVKYVMINVTEGILDRLLDGHRPIHARRQTIHRSEQLLHETSRQYAFLEMTLEVELVCGSVDDVPRYMYYAASQAVIAAHIFLGTDSLKLDQLMGQEELESFVGYAIGACLSYYDVDVAQLHPAQMNLYD